MTSVEADVILMSARAQARAFLLDHVVFMFLSHNYHNRLIIYLGGYDILILISFL